MLYNKARLVVSKDEDEEDAQMHDIAFPELGAFIEEKIGDEGSSLQTRMTCTKI